MKKIAVVTVLALSVAFGSLIAQGQPQKEMNDMKSMKAQQDSSAVIKLKQEAREAAKMMESMKSSAVDTTKTKAKSMKSDAKQSVKGQSKAVKSKAAIAVDTAKTKAKSMKSDAKQSVKGQSMKLKSSLKDTTKGPAKMMKKLEEKKAKTEKAVEEKLK